MVHILLGGTGSLGQALTQHIMHKTNDKIRIMARGEQRLQEMRQQFADERLSFSLGDVRDVDKLRRIMHVNHGTSVRVYHLAALKHVHSCEYSVAEAVKTNIDGVNNVVQACVDMKVHQAVFISTDKAVEPTTTYGATKMVGERIFIHGNHYSGGQPPYFHVVRYGNVLASNGSVIPIWRKQAANGELLTITDPEMTRFWWTIQDAAQFVFESMMVAAPGDVLVPKMPSCTIRQLAEIVAPGVNYRAIPSVFSEKIHETLLTSEEAMRATYCQALNAVRVSYGRPVSSETPWSWSNVLCSADHIDVDKVKLCLSEA